VGFQGMARFIEMVSFCLKFIPHLTNTAAPFNVLTKIGVKFMWA
jgi:hypothetical protein